jgi:hypothetical protein
LVKESYEDDLPPHVADSDSWIKVFERDEWAGMTPKKQCELLELYVLVYVKPLDEDVPPPSLLDAAKRVAPSTQPVTAVDFSLAPNNDLSKRQVEATLEVVAKESAKGLRGKVMTAADGERFGSLDLMPYTSCVAARASTRGEAGVEMESHGALWFLMSGAWSRSDGHVDSGGGHTVVEMEVGTKYWMVKVPSSPPTEPTEAWKSLGNTMAHLKENKDSSSMVGYRWEGIEIQPGSTLCVSFISTR